MASVMLLPVLANQTPGTFAASTKPVDNEKTLIEKAQQENMTSSNQKEKPSPPKGKQV